MGLVEAGCFLVYRSHCGFYALSCTKANLVAFFKAK
jgi:hypothetical protein